MAMRVRTLEIGIDVSKAELVIARSDRADLCTRANEPAAIKAWLETLPAAARLGVEATNTFHVALIEAAHRAGHQVFVVDGYCLNQYRKSLRGRAKTDPTDARLILRFINREWRDLRAWQPPSKGYVQLQSLLHRRATLVQSMQTLRQSFGDLKCAALGAAQRKAMRALKRLELRINQQIRKTLKDQGWTGEARSVQAVEGIGPITAAAVVMANRRGQFKNSDAFIAFVGLDVRVHQSGTHKGRFKLTKQGDPELRRLLYLAAMAASRSETWQGFYQRYLDRGLARIQALVILARKLARVAFSLLKHQTTYQPKVTQEACVKT